MTDRLPPNLLALFQPRPPLRYLPPADYAPEERHTNKIDGVAAFMTALQEKKEQAKNDVITESQLERADRIKLEKQKKQKWLVTEGYKDLYKPNEDKNIKGSGFKTLFVGRLPYEVTEGDLERHFARFGPIEHRRVVCDKNGKSRGYGFVVFETEQDFKACYKECEHMTMRGRRILVDAERGRTVVGWRPRRFGGGLGGRHYTRVPPKSNFTPSGPGFGSRPGFRGGFNDRGGFRGGRGGHGFRPPPSGPRQGYGGGGGGGRFDQRGNANMEPLPPRGNYRDRDSYNSGQKRSYDGGNRFDDRNQRPRRY